MAETINIPEFIKLFTSHESRLRAFAFSLIPHWADAEEVLQEANLIMFMKFDQFQLGTSFFSWACKIIHLKAKDFRQRQGREKLRFGDEFLKLVELETVELETDLADRERLLNICLSRYRQMLYLRYQRRLTMQDVAAALGSTVAATYKAMERSYKWLSECVERRLATRGLP